MKKNFLQVLLFVLLASCSANIKKDDDDILKSTNIKEIEKYLENTYPDDPKKSVLKPKLIALKNSAWTKGAKDAKPMEARPIFADIPKNSKEAEEFKKLIAETSVEHKDKTVQLLNKMFDADINNKEAILLFKNNSDCNLILRIQGKDFYNLAVPAKGENFIVINKGKYTLTSNVCDALYNSQKDIKSNILMTINNPEQAGDKIVSTKK
jgi:hypothetical protein